METNQTNPLSESGTNSRNWRAYLIAIIAVLIIVLVALVIYLVGHRGGWRSDTPNSPPVPDARTFDERVEAVNESLQVQSPNIPQTLAEELDATRLYFMLAVKGDHRVQSYVFEDGSFNKSQSTGVTKFDQYYSYSRDGNKSVFFAVPVIDDMLEDTWGAQAKLYVADTSNNDDPSFPDLADAVMIDETNIPHKQHPNVSNAGDVLFNSWEHADSPEVEKSNEWSIHIAKDGEPAKFLTNGFMPKWISDTEFLFLKNDGLYFANTDLTVLKKMATSSAPIVQSNNRFDISADGTMLAWTQPHIPQVFIYSIAGGSSLELQRSILEKSFWVLFSPSGNYLALQTIDLYAGGREENPQSKIEFYDIATFAKVPELEINFEGFDQMNMYMTDWVTK